MGCDIHARIEKEERGDWFPVAYMPGMNPRQYEVFGFMAGVRGEGPAVVEPRGLPDKNIYVNDDYDIGDHSFSWLTTREFEVALNSPMPYAPAPEFWGWLALMRELESARIVFGFDS